MAEIIAGLKAGDKGNEQVDGVLDIPHIGGFYRAVHIAQGKGETGGGHAAAGAVYLVGVGAG